MSLPDEFADAFAGAEEIPAPGAVITAAADVEEATGAAGDQAFDVSAAIPQPRPDRVMGPEATDLPPLPKPDLPDLGLGSAPGDARDLRLLADVQVELAVEIGRVKLPLRDLL